MVGLGFESTSTLHDSKYFSISHVNMQITSHEMMADLVQNFTCRLAGKFIFQFPQCLVRASNQSLVNEYISLSFDKIVGFQD